jgi:hypothetical protein
LLFALQSRLVSLNCAVLHEELPHRRKTTVNNRAFAREKEREKEKEGVHGQTLDELAKNGFRMGKRRHSSVGSEQLICN